MRHGTDAKMGQLFFSSLRQRLTGPMTSGPSGCRSRLFVFSHHTSYRISRSQDLKIQTQKASSQHPTQLAKREIILYSTRKWEYAISQYRHHLQTNSNSQIFPLAARV
jgi:hypothetical protein